MFDPLLVLLLLLTFVPCILPVEAVGVKLLLLEGFVTLEEDCCENVIGGGETGELACVLVDDEVEVLKGGDGDAAASGDEGAILGSDLDLSNN